MKQKFDLCYENHLFFLPNRLLRKASIKYFSNSNPTDLLYFYKSSRFKNTRYHILRIFC